MASGAANHTSLLTEDCGNTWPFRPPLRALEAGFHLGRGAWSQRHVRPLSTREAASPQGRGKATGSRCFWCPRGPRLRSLPPSTPANTSTSSVTWSLERGTQAHTGLAAPEAHRHTPAWVCPSWEHSPPACPLLRVRWMQGGGAGCLSGRTPAGAASRPPRAAPPLPWPRVSLCKHPSPAGSHSQQSREWCSQWSDPATPRAHTPSVGPPPGSHAPAPPPSRLVAPGPRVP